MAKKSRPCAGMAYCAFEGPLNRPINRFLDHYGAKPVSRKQAPDSRLWYRLSLSRFTLEQLQRAARANGIDTRIHGPWAKDIGIVLAPTGAGAIGAHAKQSAIRNEKYRSLESSGAIGFQALVSYVFTPKVLPDFASFFAALDRIARIQFGVLGFAALSRREHILGAIETYLLERLSESRDEAKALLLGEAIERLAEYQSQDGTDRKRKPMPKKSHTLRSGTMPIELAPTPRPDTLGHESDNPLPVFEAPSLIRAWLTPDETRKRLKRWLALYAVKHADGFKTFDNGGGI